ncbi:hypothetical protein [Phyllobacterium zundukense]|uniref:Uncharacterized protein n=1 Tax=Phyllobacterium zundukense TaxID=1867719 RepID=A0ACD4CXF9_9HYPH|nr:hypothetical protein [Phyllobacterium zundukense]UXN58265.1 hypothetical protein N8E88_05510 [Phyllobacterium zundukense]
MQTHGDRFLLGLVIRVKDVPVDLDAVVAQDVMHELLDENVPSRFPTNILDSDDARAAGTFPSRSGSSPMAPMEENEMKPIASIIAALAISAMASTAAMAACPEVTGAATNDAQKGVAKDGTKAPLQDGANSTTQTTGASVGTTTTSSTAGKTVQKSGDTMPMATDKNQATSQQDAQAQQKGDKTAASAGADASDKDCKS